MKKAFLLLLVLFPLKALAGPGLWNYFVLPAASSAGQLGTYFRTDGSNYQCLGNTASALFVASASQISGGVSGTGCFGVGGIVNLTKQSSFATSGEANNTATPSESPHGLGVASTPRQAE